MRFGRPLLGMSAALALLGAAPPGDIAFPRGRIFPESITVTRGGELFTSGADDGAIWHARPGDAAATEWLDPARSGMVGMLGVFADDRAGLLWACGRPKIGDPDEVRDHASALLAFDIRTAAPKGRWPMPGGAKSTCNDMAVDRAGNLYISETAGGRIIRLKKGAAALDVWLADPRLEGLDGIAFDRDGTMYLSSVRTNRLFRLPLDRTGDPGALVELTPSRPLDRPDGMRFVAPGRLLFGEAGDHGGISEATIAGDRLEIRTVTGGKPGTTSAVAYRGNVYATVAKLRYRTPEMKGQDAGPFFIYTVPLR
ncbi:SMP-30/gluconolactonase/LRE family protein [Sphingomonas nostoxanthinifaciens]|uniref:SMP-30/gluconolactonase/LRE family protein n=1 Tax=Sphingomonas nostoxanthinifaciens TaxID=2872652 RepID=UPI001CC1F4BE|nr:SMP-30/gluconolactonase/LRE family protein [Sphingomonas nostoxanthinifaciens]UAK26263.1 hypothetical protein K8P63_09295 [Sphingomonas nostoxanthinifaciens]